MLVAGGFDARAGFTEEDHCGRMAEGAWREERQATGRPAPTPPSEPAKTRFMVSEPSVECK